MNSPKDLNDTELLHLIASGDQQAYRVLFDRYYTKLVRQAALKLNGDMTSAEDVVQQVFIEFWTQGKAKQVETSVGGYLARMMRNKTVDHIKKEVTRRTHENNQAQSEAGSRSDEGQPTTDLQEQLLAAINQMPEQQKNVFKAVYIDGMKYKEAADHFGLSINTIKTHLRLAMESLRGRLTDYIPLLILILSPYFALINDCL